MELAERRDEHIPIKPLHQREHQVAFAIDAFEKRFVNSSKLCRRFLHRSLATDRAWPKLAQELAHIGAVSGERSRLTMRAPIREYLDASLQENGESVRHI